mgnify:CR=1 FL=1
MPLSEADTKAKFIGPALHSRGWTEDLILSGLDMNMEVKDIAAEIGVKQEIIKYAKELVSRSEHMRSSPLVPG